MLEFSLGHSYIRVDSKEMLLLSIGMGRVGESNSLLFIGTKHANEGVLFFMFVGSMGSRASIVDYTNVRNYIIEHS